MNKKIFINKSELIELTEREQQIYNEGKSDGLIIGMAIMAGIVAFAVLIVIIFKF